MMYKLWITSLRMKRWATLTYCLVSFAFLAMYLSVFPSIQSQAQNMEKLLESYPKALMEAFDVGASTFSTLGGYLSVEAYGVLWQILVILLVTSFAGNAMAGEVERGTMALTAAMPVSRLQLYLSRYLAGLTALSIFVASSMLILIPIAALGNDSIATLAILKLALAGWLWGLAVYSFAFMVSAICEERSRVYQIVGGVLLLMYALNIFSGLLERLDKLKYASVFHYYSSSAALVNSRLDGLFVVVLALTVIITFGLGLLVFQRRDLAI